MAEAVFFYVFTALMLGGALSVVLNRHPIHSVLSLLFAMFCLAALYILLGAVFVAALQVLLYAGAVLVLFLFVVMLLNLERETVLRARLFTRRGVGTLVALILLTSLLRILAAEPQGPMGHPAAGTVEALGRLLFTKYLLPFELTSFLILAAIIGAVTLARQPRE